MEQVQKGGGFRGPKTSELKSSEVGHMASSQDGEIEWVRVRGACMQPHALQGA